jgi:parvulin-like peptidyl-prolyl isomerase
MPLNGSDRHPRRVTPIAALLALAAAVAWEPEAFAQRIAQQFDQQSAGATQAPMTMANGPSPTSTTTTNLTPHIPRPVSRPKSWPSSKPGGPTGDNHVLSTIRTIPGDPLDPLDEEPVGKKEPEGVIQTSFDEPVEDGPPVPGAESLGSTKVVARVGPEVVLEGDLLTPTALEWLAKVTPGMKPEQVRELKVQICKQVLPQHVDSLIVFVDACRTIPEERLPEIEKKVNEAFDAQQLPQMVKAAGLNSAAEYEALLRSRGQSIDRVRKMFFERALAQQWVQQKVESDAEIPHAEMIAWYQAHLAEYDFPAKARFEQLTVKFGATRTRQEAWNQLAEMGNDVLEGRDFTAVAKERSEGPAASRGGQFDWTTKGSLVSKVVDEAIFTLPTGQLSAILEDGNALHIVRVAERVDAGRTPFIEAQVGIKDQLTLERRKKEMDDYLSKLRERTPVWTIFDVDAGNGVQTASGTSPAAGPTRPR